MATNEYNIARGDEKSAQDYYNTINLVKVPPIIIDSHMHIMTSHCTPLPLLWPNFGGVKLSSKTIDWFGRRYLVRKIAIGNLGRISQKPTIVIGDKVVNSNKKTYKKFKEYKNGLFSAMIVMPMDMEYAHYAGFEGYKIYYKVEYRWYNDKLIGFNDYYPPIPKEIIGDNPMSETLKNMFEEIRGKKEKEIGFFNRKRKDNHKRYFVVELKKEKDSNKLSREIVWLDEEETDIFITWKKQEITTRIAAVKNPWKLIPMYHFEPRRYGKSTSYQKRIVASNHAGIFIGFKMYPSLGYNPGDFDRITGLKDFYTFCNSNKLAIISHCSPSGMPTHERPLYYQKDKKAGRSVDIIKEHKKDRYAQSPEEFYFSESYVAPKNWKPVVAKFNDLRLCLAHFGGDDKGFTRWGEKNDEARDGKYGKDSPTLWDQQIIDMIKEYKNCYVDISFFFVKKNFEQFKDLILKDDETDNGKYKIRNKILFGTDWYLIEKDKCDYKKFCKNAREQLDKIDKSLWIRFSCLNPMRFFGLGDEKIINNLKKGMKKELKLKGVKKYFSVKKIDMESAKKEINEGMERLKDIDLKSYQEFIGYPKED